jgi:hypothetical protein
VAIGHAHVASKSVEAHQALGALTHASMVVARHAHERLQPRKAASSASETLGNSSQYTQ